MKEYQEPYLILWAGITKAVEQIDAMNFGEARALLIDAQQRAEESYISWEKTTSCKQEDTPLEF